MENLTKKQYKTLIGLCTKYDGYFVKAKPKYMPNGLFEHNITIKLNGIKVAELYSDNDGIEVLFGSKFIKEKNRYIFLV